MYKRYISYIFTLLLLTACSSADDLLTSGPEGTLLEITDVQTAQLTSRAAITGTSFGTTEAATGLGVFLHNSSGGTYDGTNYSNIKFNKATSSSSWALTSSIMLSENTGYLRAYYPYNSSQSGTSITMSDPQTDYMYATTVSCSDHDASKTLTMNHAKTLLNFTITRGTYKGIGKVTSISVSGTNITGTGKLEITTGLVTGDAAAEVTISSSQTIGSAATSSISESMLVVPRSSGSQTVTVSITVDGMTKTASTTLNITKGYTNTVNLTLGDNGFSYNDTGFDYVEIGGLKWATMNVGATTVAESAETSYGNYYNYDSRTTAQSLWGGTWRVPTQAEYTKLLQSCISTSDTWATYSGSLSGTSATASSGVWWVAAGTTVDGVTYSVAGILFISMSDTTKRLFFPANGRMYKDNTYTYSKGQLTNCWSDTYAGINSVQNAYCFWFDINEKDNSGNLLYRVHTTGYYANQSLIGVRLVSN